MSSLFNLIKFNISYYLKPRFEDKKQRNKFIGLAVLLAVCFIMPLIMLIVTVYYSTNIAISQNVLPEFMSVLLFSAQIGTMVMGISTYLSVMYFSKDNVLLMSMPLKSNHIYISKFIVCLLTTFIISAALTIPAIIASAIAASNCGIHLGVLFYVSSIIGIVFVPFMPLIIISIISFPIMQIITYLKKKPILMSILTVVFSIGLMIVIYYPMIKFSNVNISFKDGIPQELVDMIVSIGRFNYPTLALSRAMYGINAVNNLLIVIGIGLACLILGILFSSLFYKKTISKIIEGGITKNRTSRKVEDKDHSVKFSLLARETKFIMRDSQLFVQTLMMLVMAPVMIFIFTFIIPSNEIIGYKAGLYSYSMDFFYITLILGMNYLATIAISREGNKFHLLKTLPVESKDIIKLKILIADIVSILGAIICGIVYCIITKGISWYYPILLIVFSVGVSCSLNAYGMQRDLKKPNLKWMNVKEITKNNMGVLIPMLLSMIPGLVTMVIATIVLQTELSRLYIELIIFGTTSIFMVLYYVVFRFNKTNKMVELYNSIEP